MYVAKVNDRGKASCVYMFDEQLVNFDDMFSKSYFMKKSSDKQSMVDFSHEWNIEHKEIISKNNILYCANIICKGVLQAPALIVLYSCIVMGAMLLFGSENFYNQIDMYGVDAFGNIRTIVIVTYIVSAILGLLASLTTYNNVRYKFARCIISILTFVIISPVFFSKVFFATSNVILTLTIIMIVGCFFIRFILDRMIVSVIRKNTEKLIRAEHKNLEEMVAAKVEECDREDVQSIMEKVRSNKPLKQYKKR